LSKYPDEVLVARFYRRGDASLSTRARARQREGLSAYPPSGGLIKETVFTRTLRSALNIKKLKVEAAVLSPARQHLATCSEIRTLLGTRVRQAGAVYDIADHSIVGHIAKGKRAKD
jgi:hypothetical protein